MKQFYARITLPFIIFLLTGFTAFGQTEFDIVDLKHACNGLQNGSLSVVVTSGSPTFKIQVIGPTGGIVEEAELNEVYQFNNLKNGSYIVVVQDINGEPTSQGATIRAVTGLSIQDFELTHNTCSGSADGSINLTVSGGTGNYRFSLDGGNTFVANPITNLAGGTYTVDVFDDNSVCTTTGTYTILDELTLTTDEVLLCISDPNYTLTNAVSANVNGGDYTFTGPGVSGDQFSPAGAGAGPHSIEVRYEVNGCTASAAINIEVQEKPDVPAVTSPAAICAGDDVDPINIVTTDPTYTVRIFHDAALSDEVVGASTSFDPDTDTPWYDNNTAGTYTYYIVQRKNGCDSDAAVVDVVVNALPTAAFASSTLEVCDGEDGTLTVNFTGLQPFTFTYNDGSQDITVSDISASSYSIPVLDVTADRIITLISVSDANTCGQTDLALTAQVTKLDKPVVTLTLSKAEACQEAGGVYVLDGGMPAGGVYFIDGIEATEISLDQELTEKRIYTIIYRYTDNKGCENEASQQFELHPLPQVSFSMAKTSFCVEDDAVSLTATPAGGVFSGPGVSGSTFNPSDAGISAENTPHIITYTFQDGDTGCKNSVDVFVEVNPMLSASVSIQATQTTLCTGDEVTFSLASFDNIGTNPTYEWLLTSGGSTRVVSNDSNYITTTLANGDAVQLRLTQGTLECGTGNTVLSNIIENIEVNEAPSAAWITTSRTLCEGRSLPLRVNIIAGTSTAPFTLTYTDGSSEFTETFDADGEQSFLVTPADTTTYTLVRISAANGCAQALGGSITITVTPTETLSVEISPMAPSICHDEAIEFTANVTNPGTDPVYTWYLNGAPVGEGTSTYRLTAPSQDDSVYVVVQQGWVACPDSDETLRTQTSAVATITGTEANAAFTGPESVCVLTTATYVPEVEGGSFRSVPAGFIDESTGVFTPGAAGDYTIYYSITVNGCTDETSQLVNVTPAADPKVTLSVSSTEVCVGESVRFAATATDAGANPVYQWFVGGRLVDGETDSVYTAVLPPAGFRGSSLQVEVRVSKDPATSECISNAVASAQETIIINQLPTVTLAGNAVICSGASTELQFTFSGIAPYTLVYSDGTTNYTIENIVDDLYNVSVSPTSTTSYTVVSLTDSKNCAAASTSDEVTVTVQPAPATSPVVSAEEDGCTSITLSWSVVEHATDYVVQVATSADFSAPFTAEFTLTGTSQQITGLERGIQYFYRVYARNSCGQTTVSDTGSITLEQLAAPLAQQPVAEDISCSSFQASWNAITDATSFIVELSADDAFTSILQIQTVASPDTSYVFSNLTANTQYYYRVQAVSTCGAGPYSNVIEQKTDEGIILTVPATAETCEDQTLAFSAELISGVVYAWEGPNGYTGNTHEVTIANAQEVNGGTYRLTVSKDGCISVYEVLATVTPTITPTVTVALEEELTCSSTTAVILADAPGEGEGAIYSWYVDKETTARQATTSNRFELSGFTSGTSVRVKLTSTLACASPAEVEEALELIIPAVEAPALTPGDGELCYGQEIIASATGENITWTVSGAGTTVTRTGATLSYTPTEAGEYTVSATQQPEGCISSPAASYTVQVKNEVARPTLEERTVGLCQGTAGSVTAMGTDVVWYSDAALTTLASNTATLELPATLIADTYQFYAVANVAECRSAATELTVVVGENFSVSLGDDISLCAPATHELRSGYSSAEYEILWNTGAETENIIVEETGTYFVTVTHKTSRCSATDTVAVTIEEEISVTVSLDTQEEITCNTTSVTVVATSNAGEGATYVWTRGGEVVANESGRTLSLASFTHGEEIGVKVYSALTCASGSPSASLTLEHQSTSAPVVSPASLSICAGEAIVLSAEGNNIRWRILLNGEEEAVREGNDLNYTPLQSGVTYSIEATQQADGCPVSATTTVSVEVKPVLDTPALSHTAVVVCAEEELPQITATTGSNIKWYADAELTQLQNEGSTLIPAELAAGSTAIYYAVATDGSCESPAVQVSLERKAGLTVNLGDDIALCAPATQELVSGYSTDTHDILWSTGETTANIQVDATGTYSVTVTDRNSGCSGSADILVEIESSFEPTVSISPVNEAGERIEEINCNRIVLGAFVKYEGDAPSYQWYRNGDIIGDATAQFYEVVTFNNGDSFMVEMSSSLSCAEPQVVYGEYQLIVPAVAAPQLSQDNAVVCQGGDMPVITETTGGTMRWFYDPANPTNPRIDGSLEVYEGASFTPSAADYGVGTHNFMVTQTTVHCGESMDWATFSLIMEEAACEVPVCEVTPSVVARIQPGNEICPDIRTLSLVADTTDIGENPLFAWYYNGTLFSNDAAPSYTSTGGFANGDEFMVEITITDERFICNDNNTVNSNATISLVDELQATAQIQPIDAVCAESNTPVVISAAGTYIDWRAEGLGTVYTWYINEEQVRQETLEGDASTAQQLEVIPSELPADAVIRLQVSLPTEISCVLPPADATYAVPFAEPSAPAVTLTSNAADGVCPGASITFTATASANAGTSLRYIFSLDGAEVQAGTSNNYVLSDPQNDQQVQVKLEVTDATGLCLSETEATSDILTVRVLTSEECVGNGFNCGVFGAELTRFVRPSCGERNGALYYQISGGAQPYFVRYTYAGEQVEQVIDASEFELAMERLPAGEVSIYLSDRNGNECSLSTILEAEPRLEITFEKTADGDVQCYGEASGKARLTVAGGNAPYEYMLEGTDTWQALNGNAMEFDNLPAGIINILVRNSATDACPAVASLEILNLYEEVAAVISITQEANCNDNIGAFSLENITGGNASLGYRVKLANEDNWRTFIAGMQFTGLARGRHLLIIENGSCQVTTSVVVPSPGLIALAEESRVVTFSCDNPALRNGLYLKIDAGITEVSGPYVADFYMMNSQGTYNLIATEELFNSSGELYRYYLEQGYYRVEVRSQTREGCPEVRDFVIEGSEIPVPITFTANPMNIYCEGAVGGVLISELQGAAGLPYQVEVYQEGELLTSRTISTFEYATEQSWEVSGLAEGLYQVIIKQDQGLCNSIEQSQPAQVVVQETDQKLSVNLMGTTVSFPERASGSLSFRVANGSGSSPYEASLVWIDRIEGQEDWSFESYGDQVLKNGTTGLYDYTYNNLPPGIYELTVTDANGCSVILTDTVGYDTNVFVPNFISPNGDGKNDLFHIRNKVPNTQLIITNRWGKVVYQSQDYQNDWGGDALPEGLYYYSIKIPESENGELKGWLQIKRGAQPY